MNLFIYFVDNYWVIEVKKSHLVCVPVEPGTGQPSSDIAIHDTQQFPISIPFIKDSQVALDEEEHFRWERMILFLVKILKKFKA